MGVPYKDLEEFIEIEKVYKKFSKTKVVTELDVNVLENNIYFLILKRLTNYSYNIAMKYNRILVGKIKTILTKKKARLSDFLRGLIKLNLIKKIKKGYYKLTKQGAKFIKKFNTQKAST
ncbi:MAG TPA: hypothetical protein ENH06_00530 [bacterium]|nr:hypothetical protein [bacterium]